MFPDALNAFPDRKENPLPGNKDVSLNPREQIYGS